MTMAFLATDERRATLPEDTKKAMEEAEIALIVKAHGFEPGAYKFEPNPNVNRRDGSIINGKVKGYFSMKECKEKLKLKNNHIGEILKGKRKSQEGYTFKFIDE